MAGRVSTGTGVAAGAAGGSAARRACVSRAARARAWRSTSAQRDAAVASWTIASGNRLWAESNSAPLNTVSALADPPPEARAGTGLRERDPRLVRLRLRQHERARGRLELSHQRRTGTRLRQRDHLAADGIVVPQRGPAA